MFLRRDGRVQIRLNLEINSEYITFLASSNPTEMISNTCETSMVALGAYVKQSRDGNSKIIDPSKRILNTNRE
ncbi:hypothetical protein K0M31_012681 [Melipona bicolor]|uniref:Uncharacterized protein n=1 Tax=Melipona bicolor TaxID=60889 RepID=A0AA40KGV6_9HYME|nr:hypothetical protein K0M31_012681 [Melipona bicolor]